jgi:ubiquitin-conjugating enzyme E2 Q
MAVAEAFVAWQSTPAGSRHAPLLLDVDEDPSGPRLELRFGSVAVTIMVPAEEGATFFLDCDNGDSIAEEWMSDINSYFAEKPDAALKDLLDFMAKTLPSKLVSGNGCADDEEEAIDEPEVDEVAIQDIDVLSEERQAKRQALVEERQWEKKVEASLGHSQSSRQASQTLMREMVALQKLKDAGKSAAIQIELVGDSLYHWRVVLPAEGFPDDCVLKNDLIEFARRSTRGGDSSGGADTKKAGVLFDVVFPAAFPFSPPFIRVVYPRFQFHTGHVTVGGSICMELLTDHGWLPTYSIESVFVQIRSEMCEGGGRIDFNNMNDYTEVEAKQAFERVARQHGWLK